MSSILEMLTEKLGGDNLSMISKQLGADEQTTSNALSSALPMLIGALSRNGATEEGAAGIAGAIEKDNHDGGILDNLGDFLGQEKYEEPRSGAGILGHLLGGKQERLQQGVSQASGLNSDSTGKLMKMLAPMVMGAVGKQTRGQNLDAGSLMGFLGKEKESVDQQGGGLIGRMLDQDGDGDFDMSDVAKFAMGKLFGK